MERGRGSVAMVDMYRVAGFGVHGDVVVSLDGMKGQDIGDAVGVIPHRVGEMAECALLCQSDRPSIAVHGDGLIGGVYVCQEAAVGYHVNR